MTDNQEETKPSHPTETDNDGFKLLSPDEEVGLLEEDKTNRDLPSWLTASDNDDRFAKKDLPTTNGNTIPDWMKERDHGGDDQNTGLSEFRWKPDADAKNGEKKFDPNQTQKIEVVKKPDLVLAKKGRTALLVIGVYVVLLNLVFWKVPTGIDNILIDVFGIYLTIYLADMGYDVRNLIPIIKKK